MSATVAVASVPTLARLDKLRALLDEKQLDAILVSNPPNRSWLSGFFEDDHGPDESSGVLLVERTRARFLTGIVNVPMAEAEVGPGFEVVDWERPWPNKVGERLKGDGIAALGIEENALTVGVLDGLLEGSEGTVAVTKLGNAVDALRSVKDEAELAIIAEAIRITDEAFVAATANLQAGATERALAKRIEDLFRELGAEGPAFGTIVAAGPHAARPHHVPGDRPIQPGEPVIIDMGAKLRGYAADLTRTVWVGEPTEQLKAIYTIVFDANAAACAGLRAGITGGAADALAREPMVAAGYEEAFTHGLGHGLGIKVHEAPTARKDNEDVLLAGQVITIEPGIYVADWGGVRIEDVAVIEDTGARVLTGAPKHPRFG
jgi:Xaa-Pro aminopeptidase